MRVIPAQFKHCFPPSLLAMASSPAPAEACPAAPRAPVVLVTGASGLVGRALRAEVEAQAQQAQEHDDGGIANAKWVWLSSKDGDLTDADDTAAIFERHRPSHVIHLAAHVGGLFANMASACSAPGKLLQRADAAAAQANNLLFYQRNTAMCGAGCGAPAHAWLAPTACEVLTRRDAGRNDHVLQQCVKHRARPRAAAAIRAVRHATRRR